MNIYDYAKLPGAEKELLLREEGLFLEKYSDGNNIVFVYYLDGFFIELTTKEGNIIDLIPFKRGYKLNKTKLHEIEKRNLLYGMAA